MDLVVILMIIQIVAAVVIPLIVAKKSQPNRELRGTRTWKASIELTSSDE